MADDNRNEGTNFSIPSGFRLVADDSFKKNAEAANDLKKLKALVPDGFDMTKLKDILTELQTAKDANKSDLEKLTAQLATMTSGKETRVDEIKTLKDENRVLQINQIVSELIAEKAAQGNYLALEFVDSAALAALDPGEGEKFLEAVHKILSTAWERQEDVMGRIGQGTAKATPAVGMAAGAVDTGHVGKSVADLQNEQIKIMQDLQNKGRMGGRFVPEETQNK